MEWRRERKRSTEGKGYGQGQAHRILNDTGVFIGKGLENSGATGDGNGQICLRPPPYAGARWTEACGQTGAGGVKGSCSSVQPASQPARRLRPRWDSYRGRGGAPLKTRLGYVLMWGLEILSVPWSQLCQP